jgi:hypothetical protein
VSFLVGFVIGFLGMTTFLGWRHERRMRARDAADAAANPDSTAAWIARRRLELMRREP